MLFQKFRLPCLCALIICLASPAIAQDPLSFEGFTHFYNLEYNQALAAFEKAAAENPQVPNPHNHVAQTLLYREMYRNGALESELVSGNNAFLRRPKMNTSRAVEKQ